MKIFHAALLGASLIMSSPALAHDGSQDSGQISVSATGYSYQAPDMVTVSAGVVTEGDTASEAMQANAAQMTGAINQLKEAGVEERHIQTSQFSLSPRYDTIKSSMPGVTSRRISGFEVRNTVTAQSDDLDAVGAMLDALVNAGANNINGVNFSLKDDAAAKSEAREEAISQARRQAQEMASAAGVRLGDIVSLTENQNYGGPRPMMMARAESDMASTPIASGEQTISVTVNMTYKIVQ